MYTSNSTPRIKSTSRGIKIMDADGNTVKFNKPNASSGLVSTLEGNAQGKVVTMSMEQAVKEAKNGLDAKEEGSGAKEGSDAMEGSEIK